MNFEWISKLISQRFGTYFEVNFGILGGSRGGLGGVLGLGGSQDRILIDFRSILGPLLGPSWLQLRGLGASWRVLKPLGAVLVRSGTHFFPISLPVPFRISFFIDFGPQNDPKIIENSMKNPCPQEAEKESFFPCLLQHNFKII